MLGPLARQDSLRISGRRSPSNSFALQNCCSASTESIGFEVPIQAAGFHRPTQCERREQQAKLIGDEVCATGAVGEQVQLLFLDTILHVAMRAVQRVVEPLGIERSTAPRAGIIDTASLLTVDARATIGWIDKAFRAEQVGDQESRIGPLLTELGFAHHPAMTISALSAIAKPLEATLLDQRSRVLNSRERLFASYMLL